MLLKEFDIPIFGLSNKTHHYEFDVTPAFFAHFEKSPVQDVYLKATIALEKTERMIVLQLQATGKVQLVCDRSLDEFEQPLRIEEKIYYQYAEEDKEISESLYWIKPTTTSINIAQLLYETVCLAIPMKKLHPRFQTEQAQPNEAAAVWVYSTSPDTDEETFIDPRWEVLKKLKK